MPPNAQRFNREALNVGFGVAAHREHTTDLGRAAFAVLQEDTPDNCALHPLLGDPLTYRARVYRHTGECQWSFVLEVVDGEMEITQDQDLNQQISLPLSDPDWSRRAWQFMLNPKFLSSEQL